MMGVVRKLLLYISYLLFGAGMTCRLIYKFWFVSYTVMETSDVLNLLGLSLLTVCIVISIVETVRNYRELVRYKKYEEWSKAINEAVKELR